MGGRMMGISTAYPNDPVIAGLLKKRRQHGLPKFSTFLWISCRQGCFVKFNPPHLVDQLHKLDEKHYTYSKAG